MPRAGVELPREIGLAKPTVPPTMPPREYDDGAVCINGEGAMCINVKVFDAIAAHGGVSVNLIWPTSML